MPRPQPALLFEKLIEKTEVILDEAEEKKPKVASRNSGKSQHHGFPHRSMRLIALPGLIAVSGKNENKT
jgi:hypothetical protein